jgi:dCMP deaminase
MYLDIAKRVAQESKDPSTKTGSVIISADGSPVSFGFNGLPRGVKDTAERYNNRDLKYAMIIHAERNSIIFGDRLAMKGGVIYIYPFMPCSICAGMIIQAGIKRVVAPFSDNPRWQESFKLSKKMFREAKVKLDIVYDYPVE